MSRYPAQDILLALTLCKTKIIKNEILKITKPITRITTKVTKSFQIHNTLKISISSIRKFAISNAEQNMNLQKDMQESSFEN